MYIPEVTLIKISVFILLLKLVPKPIYRWILWMAALTMMAFNFAVWILVLSQCRPVSYRWNQYYFDPSIEGKCFSSTTVVNLGYAFSALDIFYNVFFGLIPIPMLWHVQTTWRTKIPIFIVLSLGIL